MRLATGLRPYPLGELSAPQAPSHNWGCLLLKGRERKGKMEGRGKGGEGGKGKDDLHPTLFLGPAAMSLHVRAELTSNSLVPDVISFAASELVPACFVGEGRAETDHYVFISRFRPRLSIYTMIRTSARAVQNTADQKHRDF